MNDQCLVCNEPVNDRPTVVINSVAFHFDCMQDQMDIAEDSFNGNLDDAARSEFVTR